MREPLAYAIVNANQGLRFRNATKPRHCGLDPQSSLIRDAKKIAGQARNDRALVQPLIRVVTIDVRAGRIKS